MPRLLPLRQLGRLRQLAAVNFRRVGVVRVLGEELHRVHVELGRQIVHGAAGQVGSLRIVGRAPGLLLSAVRRDGRVRQTPVGHVPIHVGERRHGDASEPARAPGVGLPDGQRPVLLGPQLNLGEVGGPVAGNDQLGSAVQEQLHGPPAGLLREVGAGRPPAVRRELAAEAAPHVVHVRVDACGGDGKHLGEVAAQHRHALCRRPVVETVALPLDHLAVRFQTRVVDDRHAVGSLGGHIGVFECLVGIAGGLLAGGLGVGAGALQIGLVDEVRQHLIFRLDLADGVACLVLGLGGERHHLVAGVLNLLARFRHQLDGGDALGFLGGAGVERGQPRARMRAREYDSIQHAGPVQIVRILRAAESLLRAIQAALPLSDDAPLLGSGPTVVRCIRHGSLLVARPGARLCACLRRCRSGRCCRPDPP